MLYFQCSGLGELIKRIFALTFQVVSVKCCARAPTCLLKCLHIICKERTLVLLKYIWFVIEPLIRWHGCTKIPRYTQIQSLIKGGGEGIRRVGGGEGGTPRLLEEGNLTFSWLILWILQVLFPSSIGAIPPWCYLSINLSKMSPQLFISRSGSLQTTL